MKLTRVQGDILEVRAYPDVDHLLDSRLSTVDKAIEACQQAGDRLICADELAKGRSVDRRKDSRLWEPWYTGSAIYTARTNPSNVSTGKGGTPIVAVTHIPTRLSTDSAYIKQQIKEGRLAGQAQPPVPVPNTDVLRYIEQEGEGVHVISYDNLCQAKSGVISVGDAPRHPLVVPFLGSEGTAHAYLVAHEEVYKRNYSTPHHYHMSGDKIFVLHTNDLSDDPDVAMGRLLVFSGTKGDALDASAGPSLARVLGTAAKPWHQTRSAAHAALDVRLRARLRLSGVAPDNVDDVVRLVRNYADSYSSTRA